MIKTNVNNIQKEIGFIKTKYNGSMVNIDKIMTKVNGQMECIFEQGFTQETQGQVPLTLSNSIGKPLKQYEVYGNSEQDGTPTPAVPIEVESVGDKTKNLFTREYLTDYYHLAPTTGLPVAVTSERCAILQPIDVTDNSNVTVSYSTITGTAYFMYSLFNGDTLIERVANKVSGSTINVSAGNKLYLAFYTSLKENLQDIQVEDGTTATTYEPYGYKIPAIASGKNLCITGNTTQTINGVTCTLNDDGTWIINGTATATFNLPISSTSTSSATIPLEANTSYTLSGITNGSGSTYILRCTYTKNGASALATVTTAPFTLTTVEATNAVVFFRVFSGTTFNNLKMYPQIEKGSSGTAYEPYHEPTTTNIYLDQPLRKIGTYTDYIDYKNQQVVRNVGDTTLSAGTHTLSDAVPNGTYLCTQQASGTLSGQSITLATGVTNAKVYYPKATQITESITLPTINTVSGTNILDIDTSIEPSNTKMIYKRS